ncbi:MAG: S1 RNA-binding domain-containing protein [Candidatus Enterenecus sp.]
MAFEVGSVLEGKVTGITKFGAFVSLPDNRSGLVHISEIAYSYVNDVHDHLSEGQTVTVKVIGIDEHNRINLSIKQAAPPPPRPERRPPARPAGSAGDGPARSGARRPPRPQTFQPEPAMPKGPASFEDQLKQFMATSDSKLSELHMNEKRSSRRGGHR